VLSLVLLALCIYVWVFEDCTRYILRSGFRRGEAGSKQATNAVRMNERGGLSGVRVGLLATSTNLHAIV
jgi:hypothetical protein